MTSIERKVDLLHESGPIVETLRQWMVIVLCSVLAVQYFISVRRLYKTHRAFTFDCFVIASELFKIILFVLYEFLFIHLALLLVIVMIQTCLRAAVCTSFFNKSLKLTDNKKYIRPLTIGYCTVVGAIGILVLALALTPGKHINCNNNLFSYHWFILDSLDLIQSTLIIVSSCYFLSQVKNQMRRNEVTLQNISNESKNMECSQSQSKFLSTVYMFFALTDILLMLIGNILFEEDADFYCLNDTTIISSNNGGAAFMLAYSLHMILFSLMIWTVFYKIPDHYGLVSIVKDQLDISTREAFMIENEAAVTQFMIDTDDYLSQNSLASNEPLKRKRASEQGDNSLQATNDLTYYDQLRQSQTDAQQSTNYKINHSSRSSLFSGRSRLSSNNSGVRPSLRQMYRASSKKNSAASSNTSQ